MEHRWHSRKRSTFNALLYHSGSYLCTCRIENISPHGLFISAPDFRVGNGTSVDVIINALPYINKPIYSKAIVVHRGQGGAGLMCVGANPLYNLIKELR